MKFLLDDIFETLFKEISSISSSIIQNDWAESSSGNFSIRLKEDVIFPQSFKTEFVETKTKGLENSLFLVSGAGVRWRDLADNPGENVIFLKINKDGSSFKIINAIENKLKPTSEILSHLKIHEIKASRNISGAVLHVHPTEIIALTHIRELCSETVMNNLLSKMHPEFTLFLPDGISFIDYEMTGSLSLAELNKTAFTNKNAGVWEKHGVIAYGPDLSTALDRTEVVAKSAKIYLMSKSAGFEPEGLTGEQINKLK